MNEFSNSADLIYSARLIDLSSRIGDAINCYECNSHVESRCAEKIPPKELEIDCSTKRDGVKYTFCRKITQIIEFAVNGCKYYALNFRNKESQLNPNLSMIAVPPDTRTIRTCAFEEGNYKARCYQRSGFGGRQEVCACESDLCNGAVTIKATFGVLLAAIVVFVARA